MTKIKYGSNSGKFFAGMMQGAAEGMTNSYDNYRLQKGLEEVGNAKDLSPFQRFAKLSSVPGATPQMVQSGSDLLREEAKANAFARQQFPEESKKEGEEKPQAFPSLPGQSQQNPQDPNRPSPSLTTEQTAERAQEGYIPPSNDQRMKEANEAFTQNPQFFDNDPQKAINWVDDNYARDEKIANAYQKKHENLDRIQTNVVNRLKNQSDSLKVQVPTEMYSQIEDQAIQATKPKKDGGEGLTEQQAMKKYGEKLNEASKQWAKIRGLGNVGIMLRPADETNRAIKGIQKSMKDLDSTELFAQELITQNGVSPSFAYSRAQPISDTPALSGFMNKLEDIPKIDASGYIPGSGLKVPDPEVSKSKTLNIAPHLGQILKNNPETSPLAIAFELDEKGYDAKEWLQWVTDNMRALNLRQNQIDQVNTPKNVAPKINDWWLKAYSGGK